MSEPAPLVTIIEHSITLFVYGPLAVFCVWRIFPRLLPVARILALAFLAAQILVVYTHLAAPAVFASQYTVLVVLNLDSEQTSAAFLAGAQLALIGALALLVAWRSRSRRSWRRVYFAGLGALFLFLAIDEYVTIHEHAESAFRVVYLAVGVLVAIAAGIAIRRSGGGFGDFSLLTTGFALLALGALGIDLFNHECYYATNPLLGCRIWKLLEEVVEYFGAWLILLAMLELLPVSEPAPAPLEGWIRRLLYALSALAALVCLAIALRSPVVPILPDLARHSLEYGLWANKRAVEFEAGMNMPAYRLERRESGISFAPYMSGLDWHSFSGLGYSLHLVDQAARQSIASVNEGQSRDSTWITFDTDPERLRYLQRIELEFPPDMPRNRAMWPGADGLATRRGNLSAPTNPQQRAASAQRHAAHPGRNRHARRPRRAMPPISRWASLSQRSCSASRRAARSSQSWRDAGHSLPLAQRESQPRCIHAIPAPAARRQRLLARARPATIWARDCQPASGMRGWPIAKPGKHPCPPICPPGSYTAYTGLYRPQDQTRLAAADSGGEPLPDNMAPLGSLVVE